MRPEENSVADSCLKRRHGGKGANNQHIRLWVHLSVIVVASFALRVAALAYWGTGTIESEGAEYAKIAENLRNGVGFVGLVSPGPEVNFNPLFPLLIAGASFVTPSYEWAGRLVALILGALLPLPMYGIASRLFNPRVGFIAAILTVLHPLLVHLSFMVLSEGPYATLLLSAIYVVVRALSDSSTKVWLLVGGAFGLAYLVRPEAIMALLIALLFALTSARGSRSVKYKRAASAIVVFLALALPEVLFIYKSTGKLLFEGKSTILLSYTGKRILAAERNPGMDYKSPGGYHDVPSSAPDTEGGYPERWEEKWAIYGIDSHLKGTGTAMRPFAEIARETQLDLKDLFPLVGKGIRQNVTGLLRNLSSGWLGAPLLPALALLGALRRPWRGQQASARLFVMLVTAAPFVATLLLLWSQPRYYFIFVPLLIIWAANGLFEVGLWTNASSAAAGWRILARPMISQCIVPGVIGLAMIISAVGPVRTLWEFSDSTLPYRVDKEVGLWIGRQQSRPVRIMDLSLPLTYHAGAQQHLYFPYCTGDLALSYLDAAQVDYVVLRRGKKFTRYYDDWLTRGIPDHRAELLQLPSVPGADKFLVYRWHEDDHLDGARTGPLQTQNETEERSQR